MLTIEVFVDKVEECQSRRSSSHKHGAETWWKRIVRRIKMVKNAKPIINDSEVPIRVIGRLTTRKENRENNER